MATYKTPGVYIEEISTFPPSVAEVATAIPAFIGYTEKTDRKGKTLINEPKRIKSLLEYREIFGGAPDPDEIKVHLSNENAVEKVEINPQYFLYDSLRMFFANGGGDCYVVSVGDYTDNIELGKTDNPDNNPGLQTGLEAVEKLDEPTILVFPDSVLLGDEVDLGDLQKAALTQCNNLKDRFAVLDVYEGDQERTYDNNDVITKFRSNTGMQALKYGAAYYPWVRSSLDYKVDYQNISLEKGGATVDLASISNESEVVKKLDNAYDDISKIEKLLDKPWEISNKWTQNKSLVEGYSEIGQVNGPKAEMKERAKYINNLLLDFLSLNFSNEDVVEVYDNLTNTSVKSDPKFKKYANDLKAYDLGYPKPSDSDKLDVVKDSDYPSGGTNEDSDYEMGSVDSDDIYSPEEDIRSNGRTKFQQLFDNIVETLKSFLEEARAARDTALETVKETNTVYQEVLDEITDEALTLPPSGAIAGVYATVDNDRGVWKAPANVSLSNVVGPAVKITADEQKNLNIDANTGKSVNAIRQFTGKGTMVWGARTLAGNSNEWRYISVRRFYNMVEESVKKSTSWAVFEPNVAETWVKVQTMIENYLTEKWREGALAGAKPDQAFFVNVGLGLTMTQQDILEGRMNVEIGMAVVRPAEFIILKFSHKMQES